MALRIEVWEEVAAIARRQRKALLDEWELRNLSWTHTEVKAFEEKLYEVSKRLGHAEEQLRTKGRRR